MPFVMRSSCAFSRLIESFGSAIGFFSEGTWSARGWRWPTGASPGSNCCLEFVDRCAAGFREPAVCAIATEVPTRASNAIVVINFRILVSQIGPPHDHGNGKLDHKVRQASRFVQMFRARWRALRAWHHPDDERWVRRLVRFLPRSSHRFDSAVPKACSPRFGWGARRVLSGNRRSRAAS